MIKRVIFAFLLGGIVFSLQSATAQENFRPLEEELKVISHLEEKLEVLKETSNSQYIDFSEDDFLVPFYGLGSLRYLARVDFLPVSENQYYFTIRGLGNMPNNLPLHIQRSFIMLDGLPLNQDIGINFLPFIPFIKEATQGIEVIKGGGNYFGTNTFAGLVNIKPIEPDKRLLSLTTSYGTQSTQRESFIYADKHDKFKWLLSSERYYEKGLIGTDEGEKEKIEDEHLFLKGIYDNGENLRGELIFGWADGETSYSIFTKDVPKALSYGLAQGNNLIGAMKWSFNNVNIVYMYNNLNCDFKDEEERNLENLPISLKTVFIDTNYTWENSYLSLLIGIDYQNVNSEINSYQRINITKGFYFNLMGKTKFSPFGGIRIEDYNSDYNAYPRAGVVYKIDSIQTLKLLYTKGFQNPNIISQYFNANEDIKNEPEKIDTYEILYQRQGIYWETSTDFFYSDLKDIVGIDISPSFSPLPIDISLTNAHNTSVWGIETNNLFKYSLWRVIVNYSFTQGGTYTGIPKHKLVLGIARNFEKNFKAVLFYRYLSGYNWYYLTLDGLSPQYVLLPIEHHSVWDMKLSYLFKHGRVNFYIENLFNQPFVATPLGVKQGRNIYLEFSLVF